MNILEELKSLLNVSSDRLSGTVTKVQGSVSVSTSNGVIQCPKPTMVVTSGDLVIIEATQIVYNLGKATLIQRFDV